MSTSRENLIASVSLQEDYVKSLERQIDNRTLTGRDTHLVQGFLDKANITLVVLRGLLRKANEESKEEMEGLNV